MGCGGGLVAEGAGIFAVIWGWLVGRRGVRTWLHGGYCIPCWFAKWRWVLVDGPQRWIPSVGAFSWVYPGRWVVAVDSWAVLWVFGRFCGRFHGRLVVILGLRLQGGVDVGAVVAFAMAQGGSSHLKRGVHGRVDAADVARGRRSTLALPWWAFARASGEAGGDGVGLLANMGLIRVGDHLKGPVTVLLVLVGHGEGARWAGRERGR